MGPTKISLSIILCFIIPLAMAAHSFPHAKGSRRAKSFHHAIGRPSKGLPKANFAVEDLLDGHNKARAEVGVGPLKWNDNVAAFAKSYASQREGDCELVHSEGPYGENIAESSWDATAAEFVKMWVDEKQFYDQHSNTCKGGDCGHYTQVVWNTSVSVGCAKVQCKNNGWFFFTCSYDPPGNYIGERPY